MKILLLGVGMQGKAALHDLLRSDRVSEIIAADIDDAALRAHLAGLAQSGVDSGRLSRVRAERCDATDPGALARLFALGPDVAIDLMPPGFSVAVVRAAIDHGVHLVNTFYVRPEVRALEGEAVRRGVALLPEFGLDPGLDLVLLGEAVRSLDAVETVRTYGAGIPEPAAAANALRYKISWTFTGVLRSYRRPARLVRDGQAVTIPGPALFDPANMHTLEIAGLGALEAHANEDAVALAHALGLDPARLRELGRYTLRYPGHAAFWRTIHGLGLLDEEPVMLEGRPIDRLGYLDAALAPRLQYGPGESDLAIVRIEAEGLRGGKPARAAYEVVDRRDPATGLSAMSRTVGFTASIGAQMIFTGAISARGILSPLRDVPFGLLRVELARRGITIREG